MNGACAVGVLGYVANWMYSALGTSSMYGSPKMKDGEKLEPKRAAMKRARVVGRPRNSADPNAPSPRETILLEASKLFSQKGYAGTTMAEIADVVGIRGPSLYYHFADKADLLRALTDIGLGETLRDSASLRR